MENEVINLTVNDMVDLSAAELETAVEYLKGFTVPGVVLSEDQYNNTEFMKVIDEVLVEDGEVYVRMCK